MGKVSNKNFDSYFIGTPGIESLPLGQILVL